MYMQTGEQFKFFPGPYKEVAEEKRQQAGQQYLQKLAQSLLRLHDDKPSEFSKQAEESLQLMQSHLELDGYIYRNRILLPVESSVIDVQAEQSYLKNLVDISKLSDPTTIKHHINLAEEHYVNNRHSDSIGNSRHFLEAILSQTLEGVSTKLGRNLHPNVYIAICTCIDTVSTRQLPA